MPRDELAEPSGAVAWRFEVSTNSVDFWNDDNARARTVDRCFAGETTGFERRFMKKRLPIFYLELRRRRLDVV